MTAGCPILAALFAARVGTLSALPDSPSRVPDFWPPLPEVGILTFQVHIEAGHRRVPHSNVAHCATLEWGF
jgi:hypothetical protein